MMSDCIVIGGGIVGMLTARELVLEGLSVTLVERGQLGQECSWAGGGILAPLNLQSIGDDLFQLINWSQMLYPQLVEILLNDTGIDPEWQQSGLLILDPKDKDISTDWVDEKGINVEPLNHERLIQFEPVLGSYCKEALWLPDVAQIRNPRLIMAVKIHLQQLGVTILEHTEVMPINNHKQKLTTIETTRGNYSADHIIIASGAWSGQLLEQLPVRPVRGQMLCYQGPPDYLKHIVLKDGTYVIPRKDGRLLIGSTLEEAGFDKGTTSSAKDEMLKVVTEFLPDIDNFTFEHHWSGLRPRTPGGLPYIGPYPGVDGLYLNTGHYRLGLLLAPASARFLADIMLNKKPQVAPGAFQFHAPST